MELKGLEAVHPRDTGPRSYCWNLRETFRAATQEWAAVKELKPRYYHGIQDLGFGI